MDSSEDRIPISVPSQVGNLKASNAIGALYVACCVFLTASSVTLSCADGLLAWILGQVFLSLAFLQWFILLHEAGHYTLFHTKIFNTVCGHIASFFVLIPFHSWKLIHDRHHVWTGWQDLDATTEPLVPRPLKLYEKTLVNICWKTGLPLFSITYRINNFWNLPRLRRFILKVHRPRILKNTLVLLVCYVAVISWFGLHQLLSIVGLALFLTLVCQDPLLLSQHTHIPQHLSLGHKVKAYTCLEQATFTRSLQFPTWLSKGLLLNFGAHELHHMYVQVPGYFLDKISYPTHHEKPWWRWLIGAKRVSGEVFIFQNRLKSGMDL